MLLLTRVLFRCTCVLCIYCVRIVCCSGVAGVLCAYCACVRACVRVCVRMCVYIYATFVFLAVEKAVAQHVLLMCC